MPRDKRWWLVAGLMATAAILPVLAVILRAF